MNNTLFEQFSGTYIKQNDYLLPNLILSAEKEGIIEQLKANDMLLWVQKMNNISNRAMEVVNSELIFV
ncbi:MAG: TnpV protein [Eubacterium sp.]